MKKAISNLTAVVLLFCLILGNIPVGIVYGAESGQSGDSTVVSSEDNEEVSDMDGKNDSEGILQNEEQNGADSQQEGALSEPAGEKDENGSGQTQENNQVSEELSGENDTYSAEPIEENELHYIYIESPYLETPATQRIVFSFEKVFTEYDRISITVLNTAGAEEEWELAKNVDNLYLFEKQYADEKTSETYEVTSFNIERNEAVEKIAVDAMETKAQFGVNQEYEGIDELAPLDEEQAAEEAEVETSVVTIDENGVTEAQDSIASALEEAGASTPSALSDASERSGNIVVALDPGHDSTHAGASAFGLREEDLTLKIANYCKEELETYAGVSVYMTRTTSACPHPGGSSGSDIAARADAAAAAGAKIFVSFHLNSSTSSAAAGAEVIVPNSSWKPQVGQDGRALAEQIISELTKLGLNNRGIYSKDTTINERYPDGSLSDYFSVQIYNKENGIPGIIVEHAFISNSNDVNRFLASESGLKQLGVADATGIANYLGLLKGQWKEDDGNWIWVWKDGTESPQNQWLNILGRWYWLDDNGYRVSGWKTIGGQTYYFDSEGRMTTGWKNENNIWYYFSDSGRLSVGWQSIGGYWYYFTSEGKMVTGWQEIGGQTYYFHSAGRMLTGWQDIDGNIYYFLSAGRMARGVVTIAGESYKFGTDGIFIAKLNPGWLFIEENWYYINTDGKSSVGWQSIGGYWYFFENDGRMLTGWQKIGGQIYYFHSAGRMLTGWQEIAGKRYYFHSAGRMLTGWQEISGSWYYFDENGVNLHEGVTSISGNSVYTKNDLIMFYNRSGYSYPSDALSKGGAGDLEKFVEIYMEEASAEGIKAEVAFAQAMLETNYLQFNGDVSIEQFNFAGLGVVGNGNKGESFADVREGIRAHIQHLKAYANTEPLVQSCVDNRFEYVRRGSAPYVEWLGIQENPYGVGWAAAENYGFNIVKLIEKM